MRVSSKTPHPQGAQRERVRPQKIPLTCSGPSGPPLRQRSSPIGRDAKGGSVQQARMAGLRGIERGAGLPAGAKMLTSTPAIWVLDYTMPSTTPIMLRSEAGRSSEIPPKPPDGTWQDDGRSARCRSGGTDTRSPKQGRGDRCHIPAQSA